MYEHKTVYKLKVPDKEKWKSILIYTEKGVHNLGTASQGSDFHGGSQDIICFQHSTKWYRVKTKDHCCQFYLSAAEIQFLKQNLWSDLDL